jgi:phage terminase large subunit-like protein
MNIGEEEADTEFEMRGSIMLEMLEFRALETFRSRCCGLVRGWDIAALSLKRSAAESSASAAFRVCVPVRPTPHTDDSAEHSTTIAAAHII